MNSTTAETAKTWKNRMWEDIEAKNWKAVENRIAEDLNLFGPKASSQFIRMDRVTEPARFR
jgi:hypothetical protein